MLRSELEANPIGATVRVVHRISEGSCSAPLVPDLGRRAAAGEEALNCFPLLHDERALSFGERSERCHKWPSVSNDANAVAYSKWEVDGKPAEHALGERRRQNT